MSPLRLLFICLLIGNLSTPGHCSRILFLGVFGAKSTKNSYEPLAQALAKKGHDVTVVSPRKSSSSTSGLTDLAPQEITQFIDQILPEHFELRTKGQWRLIRTVFVGMKLGCELMLTHKDLVRLRGEHWDLIILVSVMNECGHVFAHLNGVPVVYFCPGPVIPFVGSNLGNPLASSYTPNFLTSFTDRMTFLQRVVNFLANVAMITVRHLVLLPAIDRVVKEKLGEGIPPLLTLEKNVSLSLVLSDVSMYSPRPHLPEFINVAGMHCRPARPLPKDLDEFIAGAGDPGVIFFSLGSVAKSSSMPRQYLEELLEAFSRLPQRVIWKWEKNELEGASPNILVRKWLPQQDLLGDPRVKVFVTHGGLHSVMEATYHGKLLFGLPLAADQNLNMARVMADGAGMLMQWEDLTAGGFIRALKILMTDEGIRKKVDQRSAVFKDQPMKPLDRAVYWTEYVIRHNGARHLLSAGRHLTWYQYHCVDVIAFIALVVMATVTLMFLLLKKLLSLCFGKKGKSKKD